MLPVLLSKGLKLASELIPVVILSVKWYRNRRR
jgi:hypothetical protein